MNMKRLVYGSALHSIAVIDVLDALRKDSNFLLETHHDIYLSDPSASEFPGVMKISYRDVSKALADALDDYPDISAEEVVSDYIWDYVTYPTVEELISAYQSVDKKVPKELFI